MSKQEIAIVSDAGGDWEGLYVNGRLMTEGHSLSVHEVLGVLGIECVYHTRIVDEDDGRLPPALVTALRLPVE